MPDRNFVVGHFAFEENSDRPVQIFQNSLIFAMVLRTIL